MLRRTTRTIEQAWISCVVVTVCLFAVAPVFAQEIRERRVDLPFDGRLSQEVSTFGSGSGPARVAWIWRDNEPFTLRDGYCFITGWQTLAETSAPSLVLQTEHETGQWYGLISGGIRQNSTRFRCVAY